MLQGIAGSFRSSPSATPRDEAAPGAPIARRSASLALPVRPPPPGSLLIDRADAAARRWGMVRGAVAELGYAERHPGIHEEVQRQREARLRGLLSRGRGASLADVVDQLRPGGLARRADAALARRSVWQARPQAPVSLEQLGRSPGVGTRVLDVLRVPSRKNLRNLWGGSPHSSLSSLSLASTPRGGRSASDDGSPADARERERWGAGDLPGHRGWSVADPARDGAQWGLPLAHGKEHNEILRLRFLSRVGRRKGPDGGSRGRHVSLPAGALQRCLEEAPLERAASHEGAPNAGPRAAGPRRRGPASPRRMLKPLPKPRVGGSAGTARQGAAMI
jgi:hypothetical protein